MNEKFVHCISNQIGFGSGNGLAPNRWQAITRTNADPVHRRIYLALGGDELQENCRHQVHQAACGQSTEVAVILVYISQHSFR